MLLSEPVTDRQPTPVNLNPAAAPVGVVTTIVGYGRTEDGSVGAGFFVEGRSSTTCKPFGDDSSLLCFDGADGRGKCVGDSGGPSLAIIRGVPTVVGISSYLTGRQTDVDLCEQTGVDVRTDANAGFLAKHAPAVVMCASDGACEEQCAIDGQLTDPDCSQCDADSDCGDGSVCDAGACVPAPASPGAVGTACTDDTDCVSGVCGDGPDGMQCADGCETDNTCPDDESGNGADDADGADDGGGCSVVVADGHAPTGLIALALFGLAAFARRRRLAARDDSTQAGSRPARAS